MSLENFRYPYYKLYKRCRPSYRDRFRDGSSTGHLGSEGRGTKTMEVELGGPVPTQDWSSRTFGASETRTISSTRQQHGLVMFDVGVNNAGTGGKVGPMTDVSAGTHAAMCGANVPCSPLGLKRELQIIQAKGIGGTVNIFPTMGAHSRERPLP
jgi:hypothetical protein